MSDVTVAQFAEVLKVPVDKLLSQLDEAGIKVKGAEDLSLIHISEPTRRRDSSRMPSSA